MADDGPKTADPVHGDGDQKRDLLEKGLLSYIDFQRAYNVGPKQAFTADRIWHFLIELGLACPLQKGEDKFILVPCLIKDSMEQKIKKKEKELDTCSEALSYQYSFDKNRGSIGKYNTLVAAFAKQFLWGESGGDLVLAYSQKIEERKLGNVGGISGYLRWHTEGGIQKAEEFEFLLLEYETTLDEDEDEGASKWYARHRGLRVYLKPLEGALSKSMLEIMADVDKLFSDTADLDGVQRRMFCRPCQRDGKPGYFKLVEGMRLESLAKAASCSERSHKQDPRIIEAMKKTFERKPFSLKSLMKMDKESLHLETFEESQIKADMFNNQLKKGEQLWIHHDRETDGGNLAARINPYAHCVIYVGSRTIDGKEVHEVVHVNKAWTKGLLKATISRQDVLTVIKPNNKVFLGHRLENCQLAGNVHKQIVARALKCVEIPIIFDYDYR